MASDAYVLAAEWVLPVASPPIHDGALVIEEGRIAWVGPRVELPTRFLERRVRVFPHSLLLPGFVNAHCHLNLTGLLGQLQGDAGHFVDWIRDLLRATEAWTPALIHHCVTAGLDMLALAGTTTVAHVARQPDLAPFFEHPLRTVLIHEVIAFPPERAEEELDRARRWLDATRDRLARASRVTIGLAPHAVYSCSGQLIAALARLCRDEQVAFSIHVAETRAEADFLRDGSGPFPEFLGERGAWSDSWRPPGVSPVRYLADLGVLETSGAAVHCNYLSDEDAQLLRRGRITPVWCPGSHVFFGHEPHPADRLLAAGVAVALGTDSLASNAALDMTREMRLAAAAFPRVSPETWLRGATLEPARVIGLGEEVGSLEAGKRADIAVLEGLDPNEKDPHHALLESDLRVRLVLVDGEEVRVQRAAPQPEGSDASSHAGGRLKL